MLLNNCIERIPVCNDVFIVIVVKHAHRNERSSYARSCSYLIKLFCVLVTVQSVDVQSALCKPDPTGDALLWVDVRKARSQSACRRPSELVLCLLHCRVL